ncbi:MAG: U32 family peptidase [Candidatus Nanoarchaeia archaeon]
MKYELLAPVGNFPMLEAAIKGGADAIYFGLKTFSMRATANNFTLSQLNKLRRRCQQANIKNYLTLNTIIYEKELPKIEEIIKNIKNKVDAIICWDPAIIQLCRKYNIPFHISTQASISNSKTANFYKKLGAERGILARELSLKQIKQLSKKTSLLVECFCHGALCVAISGRCFTSQFLFNKSANRGECLHPCRRAYKIEDEEGNQLKLENNRVMSAKDLCTLPFIEKMKKAGIKSFKIEGRNRSPEYVYTTCKIYKQALNKKLSKQEIKAGLKALEKVYHRGSSSGFYLSLPTSDDFSSSRTGNQTEKKQYIGRIAHYWNTPKAAALLLHNNSLKIGDEIYIIGNTTFEKTTIKSMEKSNKQVKEAKKGDKIGIKLPKCRKGDEVYKILKIKK